MIGGRNFDAAGNEEEFNFEESPAEIGSSLTRSSELGAECGFRNSSGKVNVSCFRTGSSVKLKTGSGRSSVELTVDLAEVF